MNTPHKPVSDYALHRIWAVVSQSAADAVANDPPALPVMLMFKDTGNEPAFVDMVPTPVVLFLHSTPRLRQAIPTAIDGLLTRHTCDVLVHITKAWGAPAVKPEVVDMLRAGVTIDALPGAREVLLVNLTTRDGSSSVTMPIKTDAEGKCSVDLVPLDLQVETFSSISPAALEMLQKEVKARP